MKTKNNIWKISAIITILLLSLLPVSIVDAAIPNDETSASSTTLATKDPTKITSTPVADPIYDIDGPSTKANPTPEVEPEINAEKASQPAQTSSPDQQSTGDLAKEHSSDPSLLAYQPSKSCEAAKKKGEANEKKLIPCSTHFQECQTGCDSSARCAPMDPVDKAECIAECKTKCLPATNKFCNAYALNGQKVVQPANPKGDEPCVTFQVCLEYGLQEESNKMSPATNCKFIKNNKLNFERAQALDSKMKECILEMKDEACTKAICPSGDVEKCKKGIKSFKDKTLDTFGNIAKIGGLAALAGLVMQNMNQGDEEEETTDLSSLIPEEEEEEEYVPEEYEPNYDPYAAGEGVVMTEGSDGTEDNQTGLGENENEAQAKTYGNAVPVEAINTVTSMAVIAFPKEGKAKPLASITGNAINPALAYTCLENNALSEFSGGQQQAVLEQIGVKTDGSLLSSIDIDSSSSHFIYSTDTGRLEGYLGDFAGHDDRQLTSKGAETASSMHTHGYITFNENTEFNTDGEVIVNDIQNDIVLQNSILKYKEEEFQGQSFMASPSTRGVMISSVTGSADSYIMHRNPESEYMFVGSIIVNDLHTPSEPDITVKRDTIFMFKYDDCSEYTKLEAFEDVSFTSDEMNGNYVLYNKDDKSLELKSTVPFFRLSIPHNCYSYARFKKSPGKIILNIHNYDLEIPYRVIFDRNIIYSQGNFNLGMKNSDMLLYFYPSSIQEGWDNDYFRQDYDRLNDFIMKYDHPDIDFNCKRAFCVYDDELYIGFSGSNANI